MAAIPIVYFDNGFSSVEKGTLFHPSIEFFSAAQMSFYAACRPGWGICPLGYSTLTSYDALGRKLVVPAIIPEEGPPPKRKFPDHKIRFSKPQVEAFLHTHLTVSSEVRNQRDIQYLNLTHDLRKISTEIYHTALNLKQDLERTAPRQVAAIQSVLDSQQMMSLRLDIIDYESGDASGRPDERIPVYRKVDKVLRCFSNRAATTRMNLRIEGRTDAVLFGPPIFEIVPFVLIENAFKYAPTGSAITVRFENKASEVIVRVESLGPKIKEREKQLIFQRNFRGEHAQSHGREGSGIGLFAAKTIVEEHFHGRLTVNQLDHRAWIDGYEFYTTRFTIILPVSADITDNRKASEIRRPVGRGTNLAALIRRPS